MKINKWLACFLLIVVLAGFFPDNALALEQILNGTFNTNDANWTSNTPVSQAYTINNFGQNAGYFQMQYTTANGAAGLYWYADGELYQTFPSAALPADVYARINSSYNGLKGGNTARGYSLSAVGTIRRDDAPATVIDTFLNYSNTGTTNFDSGWLNTTEKTTLLPGGYQYRMYLYANLGAEKQADPEMRFDNLSCNISPSGLVASETTSGECYLNWNDSTMGSPAVDYYKIYRRTSESDPWTAYDTSGSFDYTDLTPPAADAVYYAVSDVDLNGTESPLSPQAIFRTAKISITKVESTPAQVTIGQTGIGVKVYITNTGYSPASLDEVSLYFSDPAVGLYNVIQNTGLSIELASGASTIVEFSVDVLDGSNPDTDYIDAIATGTNLQTSQIITDTEADVNHSWLIRSPANLVVQTITTPSIVYRDQRDVPISITVLNDGDKNAAAYFESTEFLFSSGTYNNIRVVDPMPVTVYSGLTATVNYLVDVDINCATGTCIIDANIDFRDVNLLISSTNFDGAAVPGEWTVVAGVIKTYKGPPLYPSYTIEATSFNQGDNIVYASAANLIPLSEYRFRWYDPSSTQVQVTDPPLTTDANGVINDEYTLTGASPLGTWRITVTNVNTTTPLAETNFEVVTPAAISATLDLPNFVTLDQNFVATLTVTNTGGADVSDVTPYDLLKLVSNVGDATYISGPSPANSLIEGLSQKEFSFVYQANTVGDFQLEGSASGFDANDSSPLLTATATSNICVIQTKPVLTVNSVTETYDFVSRNQTGLIVTMEIENAGEAGVYVDAASLSFAIGSYTQTVTSPSPLPFLLAGNSTANVTFKVDVAPDSGTGVDTISGSFSCYEANDPSSTYGVSGGTTGSWEIMSASGKCSANSGFNPEQYEFEANMVVYVEFVGVLANDSHKFFIYDDEAAGTLISESGVLTANATGILGYQFTLPAAPTISKWRIEVWEVKSPGGNRQQRLGFQFFNVVNQGNLVTSLSIEPDVVELGDNVTVKMSVSNTVADSSTLYPTVPSAPTLTAGSIGTLSLVSGPTPASASIAYGSPATFTWTYLTTSNTGVGSLTLTADATGEDLVTTNSDNPVSVTSNTALSNRLLILSRDLELASASLILGDVECGQTAVVYPDLDNTGNTSLVSVNWQKALPTDNGFNIPYGYFSFSPPSGFSVATSASELSSFTLTMPYNQPAGTYIANMSVFDDINGNSARDLGEPFDEFGVEVTAPDCRVVVAADELIDLGGWPADTSAATQTFNAFNGGNLELEDLKFTQLTATFTLSEIFITPMVYGSLATDAVLIASVSAYVGNDPQGTYIATWRVWNDGPGSASDTFQVKFSIGNKSFSFTPEPFDLGNATPTYTLSNFNFDITNTGNLDITNLAVTPFDLVNGANTIPADNIFFEIPTTLAPAETKTATVTVYIPGGTAIGDYSGGQFFFDDQDDDGLYSGGANEAFNNLTLQLHVNEYWALQVIPSTVDLGGLAPGEPAKDVGFLCKNSGNATLTALTWEPTNLIYNAFTIPTTDYSFTPAPLFSAGPGVVFPATITIAVDITQDPGFYSGSFGWLFEDKLLDARDVDDPQDSFKITCQVGSKEIQVTTAGPLSVNGTPNALSTAANFSIKNTGTLILTKPKAKLITDLDDGVNTPIPAANGVCTPAVFDYMNPDQSKSGT